MPQPLTLQDNITLYCRIFGTTRQAAAAVFDGVYMPIGRFEDYKVKPPKPVKPIPPPPPHIMPKKLGNASKSKPSLNKRLKVYKTVKRDNGRAYLVPCPDCGKTRPLGRDSASKQLRTPTRCRKCYIKSRTNKGK